MPLVTRIERDGRNLKLKWDNFYLSCMFTAAIQEALPNTPITNEIQFKDLSDNQWVDFKTVPIYLLSGFPLVDSGLQKLKRKHRYYRTNLDNSNEVEVFQLQPGDVLLAYRSSK